MTSQRRQQAQLLGFLGLALIVTALVVWAYPPHADYEGYVTGSTGTETAQLAAPCRSVFGRWFGSPYAVPPMNPLQRTDVINAGTACLVRLNGLEHTGTALLIVGLLGLGWAGFLSKRPPAASSVPSRTQPVSSSMSPPTTARRVHSPAPSPSPSASAVLYCVSCGSGNVQDSKYCARCGAKLASPIPPKT